MRKPKVENKYNLKPSDINKLIVKDRSKIKEPLFWRNNVINAWCISKSIGTDADRRFCDDNEIWIGIYDKPYYRHEVHYHCTCYGGMGGYNFKEFFNYREIETEKDLETQETLLLYINQLLDEGILTVEKKNEIMKIDYIKQNENFKKNLLLYFERMISGEIDSVEIKNIPSSVFCEITNCEANDFNGWQCDWWGNFEYRGHKFNVGGCAWYGTVNVSLEK